MSTTANLTGPARRSSLRRGILAAATIAALGFAIGAGAAPANAATTIVPFDGVTLPVLTAASVPTVQSVWDALAALPNHAEIHIAQIAKNVATD